MKKFNKKNQPSKGQGRAPRRRTKSGTASISSRDFQARVAQLDHLMRLQKPKGTVELRSGEPEGTLQQVGREADTAWAGVKRIMALLNVETKSSTFSTVVAPTNAGALIGNLTAAITQGVGDNQRTGDSVKLTRLRMSIRLYYTSDTAPLQICLVNSKDGVPVVADVFETLGSTTYSGMSFENHDQRGADKWMWKKIAGVDLYTPSKVFEVDLKLDHHVLYINGTAVVSSGCLSLWGIANVAVGANGFTVQSTLDFVDN